MSGLVADFEPDQKGVPVLLKQYMKPRRKMLGFNVDPISAACSTGSSWSICSKPTQRRCLATSGAEPAAVVHSPHRSTASLQPTHQRRRRLSAREHDSRDMIVTRLVPASRSAGLSVARSSLTLKGNATRRLAPYLATHLIPAALICSREPATKR